MVLSGLIWGVIFFIFIALSLWSKKNISLSFDLQSIENLEKLFSCVCFWLFFNSCQTTIIIKSNLVAADFDLNLVGLNSRHRCPDIAYTEHFSGHKQPSHPK